jgi:hypothetical protein
MTTDRKKQFLVKTDTPGIPDPWIIVAADDGEGALRAGLEKIRPHLISPESAFYAIEIQPR